MPWRMEKPMDQKLKALSSMLDGKKRIADIAREFGISRKTLYKWLNRYRTNGIQGLEELSRAAHCHPNMTDPSRVERIVAFKKMHRHWGPKKIIDCLEKQYPDEDWPSNSTAGEWLKKNSLVKSRKVRRHIHPYQDHFLECTQPNDVWSADYKGQFNTKDMRACYPLTVTDNCARYLLACDGLKGPRYNETRVCFERIFREYGLPLAIRTDNGVPFAGLGLGGLSRLSIWWIRLGIIPERIDPGSPQQNGRHERMHRSLKEAVTDPISDTMRKQQVQFDYFRVEYNTERPHEGIGMKRPSEVYRKSHRSYPEVMRPIEYQEGYAVRSVRSNGNIKFANSQFYVSELLHRDHVGLKEIKDGYWQIYYGTHRLGYIDLHGNRVLRALKKV
jgi:putative transposase